MLLVSRMVLVAVIVGTTTSVASTTRSSFQFRLNVFDAIWAALAPGIALYLRDESIFVNLRSDHVAAFWAVSFGFSTLAFVIFRIRDGFTSHFSVHDAIGVAKAVLVAEFLTTLSLFATTRAEPGTSSMRSVIAAGSSLSGPVSVFCLGTPAYNFDS
jgi:FlaA1/EpsC-like NDP-sugar epimerase